MYQELKAKAISNISSVKAFKNQLSTVTDNVDSLKNDNKALKDKLILLTRSLEVMKACISKLSEGHIDHLNDLVNSMLKQIFDDKDYEIEFKLNDVKNGKVLDILLKETISDDEVIITDIHENGGGIQTIVGFILQVYFIIYFKQEPILFLDEQLSALSSEYIPNLIECMNQLTKEYNFMFVGIFHDIRWQNYSDQIFNINDGILLSN